MSEIKILLIDDHALLRDGLRQIIDAETDLRVVAEAGSMRETLEIVGQHPHDIVVVDIALPDGLGTDLIKKLARGGHSKPAVVLSMHESPSFKLSAAQAGCAAYVVKRAASQQLVETLRSVARGERPLAAPTGESAEESSLSSVPPITGAIPTLSKREEQVLALVAGGATNQEAADVLGVSVKTVEGYRLRVTRKLGVRTRAQLVRVAMAAGLIHD